MEGSFMEPKYNRILLKISGEALAGETRTGINEEMTGKVAKEIRELIELGVEVAIVVGGGNFWRGRSSQEMNRETADYIGMLATVMNCIYVSDVFRAEGLDTTVMTPFICSSFTERYEVDSARRYLSEGKVVFFAGGTGHPYFSTDTGVVLRALEIKAESILLAKAVDGVYDCDPSVNPNAKRYSEVSIEEVLDKKLQVVDLTASVLARDNHMEFRVFALQEENSIERAVSGNFNGTIVTSGD